MLITYSASAQYITIDNSKNPTELVQSLFPAGSCIQPTNIRINGYDFGAGEKSFAAFDSNGSGFPLAKGLLISTGKASSAEGPNASLLSEGPTGWAGDSDLETAISETSTINATVVEFDFTAVTDYMSFDYIFSSEQYLSNPGANQCNYSDGFAFLLRQNSSTVYQNLAVIPGTSIPVKVTTVRAQTPNCPAANPGYFGGFNGTNHPTNFNGQTIVLKAEANIVPGASYHIKMVVADQGNNLYDSAIFIGGESFENEINIGTDRLFITNNPLCEGESLSITPTPLPGALNFTWSKNGTPISGHINTSSPDYTITEPGTYTFSTVLPSCTVRGYITVEYASLTANDTSLTQCDDNNDGITTFNLTTAANIITGGNANMTIEGYYQTLTDAQNLQNRINNPANFQNLLTDNTVTVRVKNQYNCVAYAEITLQIANNTLNSIPPVEKCDADNDQDGITQFDLNEITQTIEDNNTLPVGSVLHYFSSASDAVLLNNPISSPFTNTQANTQILYARIVNGSECYGILPVSLKVNTFSPNDFEDETKALCLGNTLTLGVQNGFSSYSWNTTPVQTTASITVSSPGTYTVTVTNNKGCRASKTFTVTASAAATITNIEVESFNGHNNAILIHVTGIGDYEYSLDNLNFQDSNLFSGLPPGEYTVYVHDKNNCGITISELVYVLDYPNFFTPNGDGFNDFWQIENLSLKHPGAKIYIFDRYGKLLKQLSSTGIGWNGSFNHNPLPSNDYWFTLELENGRIIKGHFALKR
ncbi:choice-of-anchor L domain-containing protein [Flavobacterium pedocola]